MPVQRPVLRRLPPNDPKWLAIAVALLAMAWVLATSRYLPFQDIPNHVQLLEMDRHLGEGNEYVARSEIHTLGYSLYIWLSRFGAGALSPMAVLRWLVVVTAVATPLAVGAVARSLGISPGWAILLALPLGVSWPMRVGLVPYVLAIPPALMATAVALREREPSPRGLAARLELMAWSTLTYLAHAYVFVWLCLVLFVAWGSVGRFRRQALSTNVIGAAPGMLLLFYDLRQRAFDPIAATAVTLFHAPRWFRPVDLALAHLVTRSYGITGFRALLAFLPLIVLLSAAALLALFGRGELKNRHGRMFVALVAVAGSLGTFAIPESQGLVFLLASRTLVIGTIFWTLLAASVAARLTFWGRASFAIAALFALSFSLLEVTSRARQVARVVGPNGPERLEGRYLTVQVPDCAKASSHYWGGYDSFRHLWAYALSEQGFTPYLFSASRYQPIWYRSDTFRDLLRGPPEHPMNENELPLDAAACREVARARLREATNWADYDGVIVTSSTGSVLSDNARTGTIDSAISSTEQRVLRRLSPGIALLVGPPAKARAQIDFGSPAAHAHLARGWSTDEWIDDRTAVWSDGPSSTLTFSLTPKDTPYVLCFYAKGIVHQTVSLVLNDQPLGEVRIPETWERIHVAIERRLLASGRNRLSFAFSTTVEPVASHDRRKLAVLLDELWVEPVEDRVSLAIGSEGARVHLLSGWGPEEIADGQPAVKAVSAHPRIDFFIRRLPRRMRLRITGRFREDVPIASSLNGKPLGSLVSMSHRSAEIVVAPGALRVGRNELELWDGSAPPSDETPLDLALHHLSLEGLSPAPLYITPGAAEDRPYLADGWGVPEGGEGVLAATMRGERSSIHFDFDLPHSDHYLAAIGGRTASLSAGGAPAREAWVDVVLNGRKLTTIGWQDTWTLASSVLGSEVRAALSPSQENVLELRRLGARGDRDLLPVPIQIARVVLTPISESDHVDAGDPAHRLRLRDGFSNDERGDGRSCAWTDGRSAEIAFYVLPAGTDYELSWHARAYAPIAPNPVELAINGRPLARIRVPAEWSEGVVSVPRSFLRAGANFLGLAMGATARPKQIESGSQDDRELGLLLDAVSLRPAPRTRPTAAGPR